eukprot:TRINITY_DN174_c0_g1_i1.p2 TRINITY_DN174_c0_g1~~TRINITY_DN174_c0_g1_i1.p2  ORF type:complete len:139 (+),score=40.68 TRINITY_DN174_c0_g1_i1:111-527(+)
MFRQLALLALVAVPAAAWSVSGFIINRTPYDMQLLNYNCTSGRWIEYPTASVYPNYMGHFEADGGSLGTAAGKFIYAVSQNGPQVYFDFRVGTTNNFNVIAIPPNVAQYATGRDSRGSVVNVTITQSYDGTLKAEASA